MLKGDLGSIERDAAAAPMLSIIRGDNALGDFGPYQGVFEVSLGLEGFTPTDRARPTAGRSGEPMLSRTAIITTYADAEVSDSELADLVEQLARAHPWELPVIEVSQAHLIAARSTLQTDP